MIPVASRSNSCHEFQTVFGVGADDGVRVGGEAAQGRLDVGGGEDPVEVEGREKPAVVAEWLWCSATLYA